MRIRIKQKGSFKKTEAFLENAVDFDILEVLHRYGQEGTLALALATPVDTGLTASSWEYNVRKKGVSYFLEWSNTNEVSGVLIAVLLQYGHATKNGGYVTGIDYINPTMRPIFETIANEAWKEVVNI